MAENPEPTNEADDAAIETELSRDLGLVSTLAIGVGTMVAAGIFTLSGLAVGYVGSAAIVSFLLAAVVATFTALTYCEFTSIYPESGEGYLYARRTFPALIAYMVGWCLLMGYTASCAFYIASLSSYFNEFIWDSPFEMLSGLVVVVGLTLLNTKGTKESGNFQVVVTIGKILLLIWFIGGGIFHVDPQEVIERFSTDFVQIGSTAALVFITFFGFSAIAASAGEVKNPTKVIPRAIFISMGVVTVLYSLVVLVVVAANLSEYSESAMGTAAVGFLGPVGGMVIVAGALFSMISASNASILAGSRVALSMSQLHHLPKLLGRINAKTRTPIIALISVGTVIAVFATFLPLEDLAHFADCVLLIALILVNAALIQHRRKFPHLRRPFRVPLVPLLPILGIIANLYLLAQIPHLVPVLLALGALALGFVGFMGWKGAQVQEQALPGTKSRVALEHGSAGDEAYRVLVPIASDKDIEGIIDVAAAIVKPRGGKIILLRVALEKEQLPPEEEEAYVEQERKLLDKARARAHEHGVPVRSLVRLGRDVARAILETARERECKLIILAWQGHTSTAARVLGQIADQVVIHARNDIMLVKLIKNELPERLLLPTAGGGHARKAEHYAADLAVAADGNLTLCAIIAEDEPEEFVESEKARLSEASATIVEKTDLETVVTEILRSRAVAECIVEEGKKHDAIVVGAAGQSFSNQILFGSIPEEIARMSDRSVIVIKSHHTVKALFGRVMSE